MRTLHNIRSVAIYESKILLRSWFFKVFSTLALIFFFLVNLTNLIQHSSWVMFAIPANIAYFNLGLLNMAQSVIAIFLSSEFLKRDKKLDTSEVFYVRPLSNAEYVIGKIWGDLRVFFVLDAIIIGMVLVFNYISPASIDIGAYFSYFFLICIPSIIYIIGLSIFLMLLLNNQALTFIILLGYIGVSIFYIDDKLYFLFDYIANSLPMMKSVIVGMSRPDMVIVQRLMFLSLGLVFTCASIVMFKRLPNSWKSILPWKVLTGVCLLLSLLFGYGHISRSTNLKSLRAEYIELNNKYVHSPKIVATSYRIDVEQAPDIIIAEAHIEGLAIEASKELVFTLNPGMEVVKVTSEGRELPFVREKQIIIVDMGRGIEAREPVSLAISYRGRIDESICYLDISDEEYFLKNTFRSSFNIDKRYAFQEPDYVLMTPETYWYPVPGTSYSDVSLDWKQTIFCDYALNIKPLEGLVPISHGEYTVGDDGVYRFSPDFPMQSATFVIGDYERISTVSEGVEYSAWYIKGNDKYFRGVFDSIADTIPSMIFDVMDNIQRTYKLEYTFDRFSIVETPAQFVSYTRMWTQAHETMQPEFVLFPEKGYTFNGFDFDKRIKDQIKSAKQRGREITDTEARMRALNSVFWSFNNPEYTSVSGMSSDNLNVSVSVNPYFIYPQLYNFRYNIYSPQWAVANRLVEVYLRQSSQGAMRGGWLRELTGLSNEEKANILVQEKSFVELLSDTENKGLVNTVLSMSANRLFAQGELYYGVDDFRELIFSIIKDNEFSNLKFESLLDSLSAVTGADFDSAISQWDTPLELPSYVIATPKLKFIQDRNDEFYQMELLISNVSDVGGILSMEIPALRSAYTMGSNDPVKWMIELEPNETKRLVSHWDEAPRSIIINTMMSRNLPQLINQALTNVDTEGRMSIIEPGEYIVSGDYMRIPGELIVDNEDEGLFSLSAPAPSGYLQSWLIKEEDDEFRYKGLSRWRAPIQWTLTTDMRYHGETIRSAYVIKGGKGGSYARWKIPVPEEGQYELYYYVNKPEELRRGGMRVSFSAGGAQRGGGGQQQGNQSRGANEWQFKVDYDGTEENAFLDLGRVNEGWAMVGVYNFRADTVTVTLTDKTQLSRVIADAVKIVKR